jgi:hypothetical protein
VLKALALAGESGPSVVRRHNHTLLHRLRRLERALERPER